ncbi:MAG: hypothetical protein QG632_849 [Candidatus Dependentiae bacterium]|nr:hypothetical protein [Candidatus Dependentiae bacterium]
MILLTGRLIGFVECAPCRLFGTCGVFMKNKCFFVFVIVMTFGITNNSFAASSQNHSRPAASNRMEAGVASQMSSRERLILSNIMNIKDTDEWFHQNYWVGKALWAVLTTAGMATGCVFLIKKIIACNKEDEVLRKRLEGGLNPGERDQINARRTYLDGVAGQCRLTVAMIVMVGALIVGGLSFGAWIDADKDVCLKAACLRYQMAVKAEESFSLRKPPDQVELGSSSNSVQASPSLAEQDRAYKLEKHRIEWRKSCAADAVSSNDYMSYLKWRYNKENAAKSVIGKIWSFICLFHATAPDGFCGSKAA